MFFSRNETRPVKTTGPKPAAQINPVLADYKTEIDTVEVLSDNFMKPVAVKRTRTQKSTVVVEYDSLPVLQSRAVDLSVLQEQPIQERKLKFVINSPVFYLNDLKVTDYKRLYFKGNHFVNLSTVSADKPNREERETPTHALKQSADYYLHEELANAMRLFKKGSYHECFQILKTVKTYNTEDINCSFYMAMCYYHKKNYSASIELFDQCIRSENNAFLEEAMYYKALALRELGEKKESKRMLEEIVNEGGFYAGKAAASLKN